MAARVRGEYHHVVPMLIEPAPNALPLLLYLALPPLMLGLVLIRFAYFGARRGETPHCRRCNYALTGLSSERCPECGQSLSPKTIVHGERRRRPGLGLLGGFLLLMAVANAAIILAGDRVKWYQLKPTSWVIEDAADASQPIAVRAWEELMRRGEAGKLTEGDENQMTELALLEQANGTPGPIGGQLLQYLGRRAADGKLSVDQRTRFIDQGMRFTLTARQKIARGDPLVYRLDYTGRGAGSTAWWSRISPVAIRVDGELVEMTGSTTSTTMFGGGGAMTSDTAFARPGTHTLAIDVDHEIRTRPVEGGEPFAKRLVTLTTTFTVLPDRPDDVVKMVEDGDVHAKLHNAITVNRVSLLSNSSDLNVRLTCRTLPVNVAFEIIGRVGDQQFPIGTMALGKGRDMGYGLHARPTKPVKPGEPITIILRSSDSVARRTVDIYEAWKGELAYEETIGGAVK